MNNPLSNKEDVNFDMKNNKVTYILRFVALFVA